LFPPGWEKSYHARSEKDEVLEETIDLCSRIRADLDAPKAKYDECALDGWFMYRGKERAANQYSIA
jgi:hypothetical protein